MSLITALIPHSPDMQISSNDDGDNGSNALIQATVAVPGIYYIKVTDKENDIAYIHKIVRK